MIWGVCMWGSEDSSLTFMWVLRWNPGHPSSHLDSLLETLKYRRHPLLKPLRAHVTQAQVSTAPTGHPTSTLPAMEGPF